MTSEYTYTNAPNVRATMDPDTLTVGVFVDDVEPVWFVAHDFSPRAGLTDRQAAATLLSFYSAYAEYARPDSGAWDAEGLSDSYSDSQRDALYMIGSDGFYMWAEDLAPTCAEGCGRYVDSRLAGSPCESCS